VVPCRAAEQRRWWEELPAPVLAELPCAQFELGPPPPWRIAGGELEVVKDRWDLPAKGPADPTEAEPGGAASSRVALESRRRVQLSVGSAAWQRYAVTAEVMLGGPAHTLTLAAATPDEAKPQIGYQLEVKADRNNAFRLYASAASRHGDVLTRTVRDKPSKVWLSLWSRPDLQMLAYSQSVRIREAALKRLTAEFAGAITWADRWLRLRIELMPQEVRLWADGLLVASVPRPKWTSGGVCLSRQAGDRGRLLRVEKLPDELDGVLPLDLTARFNADGLAGGDLGDRRSFSPGALPPAGRLIQVAGVPMAWASRPGRPNHLDLGRVSFRGRDGYIHCEAASNDPKRVMLRVPRRQYNELVLLAAADTRSQAINVLNARMVKPMRGMVLDCCQAVPRWDERGAVEGATALDVGLMSARKAPAEPGRLWLVRVRLDPGAFQDFLADERETALELDLTGPPVKDGYPEIVKQPLGVHLFAATLVESPVEMHVTSSEAGHIFVQPQVPEIRVRLRNTTAAERSGRIEARVTDFYGKSKVHTLAYSLPPGAEAALAMRLPADVLGLHDLDVRLLGPQGEPLVRRRTTMALLPPDTRQAARDSPFGIWVFIGGHFGAGPDAAGSLIRKMGARWSHVSRQLWDEGFSQRYKIYPAYISLLRGGKTPEEVLKYVQENPQHQYWEVFAETAISGRHYGYFPPELLENPAPAKLTEEDEQRFKELWQQAVAASMAVRTKHPELKLSFGNGYPQFIATFLSRKYPRELMDGVGLDFAGDGMSMFYYLKEVAKHYGYSDLALYINEGFYVTSGCGYYPDREREKRQSDVYVRGFLRGLAMSIQRFGAACEIWDPGSDYYYTGYGSVGLCHKAPELNPKPGYCAVATMTRLLDRARFHSVVPTNSTAVAVLRFDGPGGPVYALWTTQGRRAISLAVAQGARPRLTDGQGNSRPLAVQGGRVALEIDPTPVWLEGAGPVSDARLGTPVYPGTPAKDAQVLVDFRRPGDWAVDPERYDLIEQLDVETPVRRSEFALETGEGRAARRSALSVRLRDEPSTSPHRLRYAVLRPKAAGPVIPGGTGQVGLWIQGNGAAWVDLELTDAKGQRWTTVRRPRNYCYGPPYPGFNAFDGWNYVAWPLPGTPGASSDGRPGWANWRSDKPDRVLDLPATLTGVIVEQFGKVLHINDLMPPSTPTWSVGEILIERPPE